MKKESIYKKIKHVFIIVLKECFGMKRAKTVSGIRLVWTLQPPFGTIQLTNVKLVQTTHTGIRRRRAVSKLALTMRPTLKQTILVLSSAQQACYGLLLLLLVLFLHVLILLWFITMFSSPVSVKMDINFIKLLIPANLFVHQVIISIPSRCDVCKSLFVV